MCSLDVNVSKTLAMSVGPSLYRYDFHSENTDVKTTNSLNILGVILDNKLSFKPHISDQLKKPCAKTFAQGAQVHLSDYYDKVI